MISSQVVRVNLAPVVNEGPGHLHHVLQLLLIACTHQQLSKQHKETQIENFMLNHNMKRIFVIFADLPN